MNTQGLVTALKPEEQFRAMLRMVVERTQTAAIVSNRNGGSTAAAITVAIDDAVERHAKEWEKNLIEAWSELNVNELKEVCAALEDQDQATFVKFSTQVGPNVQSRNEPLLRKAGAEVLAEIM